MCHILLKAYFCLTTSRSTMTGTESLLHACLFDESRVIYRPLRLIMEFAVGVKWITGMCCVCVGVKWNSTLCLDLTEALTTLNTAIGAWRHTAVLGQVCDTS